MQKRYYFLSALLLSIGLSGCQSNPEPEPEKEPEPQIIEGTFVRIDDSLQLLAEASDTLLIEEIHFFPDHCKFTYDSIGYRGLYGIRDQQIWVLVKGEFDTLRMVMHSDDELSGEGFIAGTYLRKGSDVYEKARDSKTSDSEALDTETKDPGEKDSKTLGTKTSDGKTMDTKTSDGKTKDLGTQDNTNTSDAKTLDSKTADAGAGKKATVSFGENLSGNTYRVRMSEPYTGSFKATESAKIYLSLTIDAQGNVMKAENNTAKTNTQNAKLIEDVIALAKKIKYNKEPNAKPAKIPLTVTVNVN